MIDSPTPLVSEPLTNSSLVDAREYVLKLFNTQSLDQKLVFHNLRSTLQLVKYATEIGLGEKLSSQEFEVAVLSAWFCFSGYLDSYEHPLDHSIKHLKAFGTSRGLDSKILDGTIQSMGIYFGKTDDGRIVNPVFKDAIKVFQFGPQYKLAQNLLQYEIELNGGSMVDKLQLQKSRLDRLLNAQLNTPYAIENYGQIIGENILGTRKQIQKLDPEEGQVVKPEAFSLIEEGIPNRGIQSYFRSIYRVHINLSAIADNKANIMISVNAILISVLISLLSYKNLSETNPTVMVPVLVFIISGLASLIFAVLSARPKITYPNKNITDRNILKRNVIFFGSYVTMNLDDYEDIMDEVFQDGKLIYGNMIRDMYYLGIVLDKKYKYLIVSYNIFMIGFAITVLTFLAILFMG